MNKIVSRIVTPYRYWFGRSLALGITAVTVDSAIVIAIICTATALIR